MELRVRDALLMNALVRAVKQKQRMLPKVLDAEEIMLEDARAAIRAMREPTASMEEAGLRVMTDWGIWRAMIDAASPTTQSQPHGDGPGPEA